MKDFFLFINFNLILESRNLRTSKLCTKQPNYCLNYTFTRESHTIFGACFDTAIWCCHEPINQWLHSFQMEAALSLTASNCSSTTGTRRSWTNFVASICREKSWQLFRFSKFCTGLLQHGGRLTGSGQPAGLGSGVFQRDRQLHQSTTAQETPHMWYPGQEHYG